MKISRQLRQHIAGWICPELIRQVEHKDKSISDMRTRWADDQTTIGALKAEIEEFTQQNNTLVTELIQKQEVVSQMRGVLNRLDWPTRIKPPQLPEINPKSVVHNNVVPLTQTIGQT